MDLAPFETWLGRIADLTEAQRQPAWRALALAEAADGGDIETPCLMDEVASQFDQASDEARPAMPPPKARSANPVGTASVAELGQRRVYRIGCPHCDSREVVR
jgi:hypothetical protein